MPASSKVWRQGRRIPTDQTIYIDQSFSCRFSVNLWKDACQEIREDSLNAACCPAISSHTLVGIYGGLVPWDNSSSLLKVDVDQLNAIFVLS